MEPLRLLVNQDGHSLELRQEGNQISGAHYCATCKKFTCLKIAKFNMHYVVKLDPTGQYGWHVIQAKGK